MGQQSRTSIERVSVKEGRLLETVKDLVHEGNVRRVIIKDADGRPVMEVPVTVGVVGVLVAPALAALGALAALAADYSIEVEREAPDSNDADSMEPYAKGSSQV
jgi:hypothetical protein